MNRTVIALVAGLALVVAVITTLGTTPEDEPFIIEVATRSPATAPIPEIRATPTPQDVGWVWRCQWHYDGAGYWWQSCFWDYYLSDCWEGPVNFDCGWG